MTKAALRRQLRAAIAALSADERRQAEAAVAARLRAVLPSRGDVLAYAALPDELGVDQLLGDLAATGRLLLPRVGPDGLEVVRVDTLASLAPGAYGIREPVGPAVDAPRVGAVLLPGRGFDRLGGRLGRGSGYYDRWLAHRPEPLRVGVALDVQLVERVPTDVHDVMLDLVVTPSEVVRTGHRPLETG